jgi:hypothetical protein
MLIYHPAYDIYHTAYRILSLLGNEKPDYIEYDRARIYDFILLFPHDLKNVRMPVGTGSIRKEFSETPYNKLPNRRKVFNQVGSYFDLSIQCLISYGALDMERYKKGELCKGQEFDKIYKQLKDNMSLKSITLFNLFKDSFSLIPLNELKKRFQYQ